jgi:hypothetical protein
LKDILAGGTQWRWDPWAPIGEREPGICLLWILKEIETEERRKYTK